MYLFYSYKVTNSNRNAITAQRNNPDRKAWRQLYSDAYCNQLYKAYECRKSWNHHLEGHSTFYVINISKNSARDNFLVNGDAHLSFVLVSKLLWVKGMGTAMPNEKGKL